MSRPEPWLRGPITGTPALLQPAAHAFLLAREDTDRVVAGLHPAEVWATPGASPSIGFHLAHLAGSTDRLLTYARGEALSEAQLSNLRAEASLASRPPAIERLLEHWHQTVDAALGQLASTPESALLAPREVGRARLPSTVLGLLFHAAEHASRHVGQIVTLAAVVRGAPNQGP